MYKLLNKLFAILAILVLLPIMAILYILVISQFGKPALFRQRRIGYKGKVFNILKFRSMTSARDDSGKLKPDVDRLTHFGRWLRATSLDELPELFNIAKGDMFFVGPRPLVEENRSLYTEEQFHRHDVMPGITGWAQINGRNAILWNERLVLDLWYVKNRSVLLDMQIIIKTIVGLFNGTDINSAQGTGIPYSEIKSKDFDPIKVATQFHRALHGLWHLTMRIFGDIIAIIFSVFLGFCIRYGFPNCLKEIHIHYFWLYTLQFIGFIIIPLAITGVYKNLWRLLSLADILRFCTGFATGTCMAYIWRYHICNVYPRAIPASIIGVTLLSAFWLLMTMRLLRRMFFRTFCQKKENI